MRVQNRYKAKPWFKPWMFRIMTYPWFLARNITQLHQATCEDIDDMLFEWDFSNTR